MLFASEPGFNINSGLAVGVTPLEDILKGAPVPKHMGSGQRRWNGDGRTLSDSIWRIIIPKKYRNYNRCLLLKYFVTECWLGINLPRLFHSAQGQGTAAGEEQQEATWACCAVWLVFKKRCASNGQVLVAFGGHWLCFCLIDRSLRLYTRTLGNWWASPDVQNTLGSVSPLFSIE